jgi:hypothetical protein
MIYNNCRNSIKLTIVSAYTLLYNPLVNITLAHYKKNNINNMFSLFTRSGVGDVGGKHQQEPVTDRHQELLGSSDLVPVAESLAGLSVFSEEEGLALLSQDSPGDQSLDGHVNALDHDTGLLDFESDVQ